MILDLTQEERENQMQIYLASGIEEILSICSEECCELAHAVQKMRRILHGTTPENVSDVREQINEEAGDVLLLLDYLVRFKLFDLDVAIESAKRKNKRWYGRVIG